MRICCAFFGCFLNMILYLFFSSIIICKYMGIKIIHIIKIFVVIVKKK
jgi:hypothetical protein